MTAPLSGLRVVVTRARHQAGELERPLQDAGAEVVLLPVIEIGPPAQPELLQEAAATVQQYDWIIFSSVNAVLAFAAALPSRHGPLTVRVAAVGEVTADCAREHGFSVALVPEKYVAESLVMAFAGEDLKEQHVLIPAAEQTRDIIAPALRAQGASVDLVGAYCNTLPQDTAAHASRVFDQRSPPEWLTFASSSAVHHLMSVLPAGRLNATSIASIGPVTSSTIREYGLIVAAEANPHTIPGLVDAIVRSHVRQSN